jgi:two-component system sensor histidine kinase RegB
MTTQLNATINHNASALANLRSLLAIRSIALLGQTAVLAYVLSASRTTESLLGLGSSLVLMAILTIGGWWRSTRDWPVTEGEFLAQLLLDVMIWSALMYFSGGATNPFISYYIVPIVVAAAVLPWRYTWIITAASLLGYSLLLYNYQPFPLFSPHASPHQNDSGQAHTLGMWFNFLFSAGLITYFVVRMAAILRLSGAREARQREERLRNDQIMAVASLAAGTAHELGTPLSTMTVTVDELLADNNLSAAQREDCELLAGQLQLCRETLRSLSRTAEMTTVSAPVPENAWTFVQGGTERWAVRRPGVSYDLRRAQSGEPPEVLTDSTLLQALENLLNNAADTGSPRIRISLSWDSSKCCIAIRDWGPGLPPEQQQDPGKAVMLSVAQGMGIGLMLSHASVERFGGQIELRRLRDGTEARLLLPVHGNNAFEDGNTVSNDQ